ncbi:hypothetical protein GA0070558_10566 [Micromonospora haikouensis]|uniref:Uncharacterized protein n=1 Tax=Micromonospora haikouensis TaxID=686309 RepID=A0A1C4UUQ4_9ACTN|nr:hypothetical protein GA0070558_10566 [Micromonospora haikouensis]
MTRSPPGVAGPDGVPPPVQEPPLTVQLVGSPVPATTKPNEVLAPGARVPFQDRLVKVCRWPEEVSSASQ